RTVKKRLITDQTTNSRSTSPESEEAESGKSGNGELMSGGSQRTGLGSLPPPQEDDQEGERHHGRHGRNAQDVQGGGAVAAHRRIVVEAVEEELVDDGAELAVARLHQAEPDVAGRKLDPQQIARHPSLGGE